MRLPILALAAVLLAPSVASATGYMNTGYMNTGYMNTGYMNTGYMNTGYMNTGYMNGGSIGGFTLPQMTTSQGQPIDNVALERDYLTGSAWVWEFDHLDTSNGWYAVFAWHYRAISKAEFLNATFEATINDQSTDALAGTVTMKITAIKSTVSGMQTYYQHVVEWVDAQSGVLTPVCGCENGSSPCTAGVPATLVEGQWNYTQGTIDGGKQISSDPNLVTVACGQAAISKCASDKSTFSPSTPSSTGPVSPAQSTWIHKAPLAVYRGTKLTVKLTGMSGDADLYVKWDAQPTSASYTCRPYAGSGVNETCTLTVPSWASKAYISIYGYSASSATMQISSTGAQPRGMGYKPYGTTNCSLYGGSWHCTTSPLYEHQSCTRMVTADYCGDGTPHTITGRPIDVYDFYNPTVNSADPSSDAQSFESEWTSLGANSVGTCRVNDLDLSAADPKKCPVYSTAYGSYQHPVSYWKMYYNAYGQEVGCMADQSNSGVYMDRPGYLYNFHTGTFYPRQSRAFSQF